LRSARRPLRRTTVPRHAGVGPMRLSIEVKSVSNSTNSGRRLARMLNQRARLFRAALPFLALEPREPELPLLHRCFDTWRGIGDIVAGIARSEDDLELRRYNGQLWRRDLFHERLRALAHCRRRERVGVEPMGGRTAGRRRCALQATRWRG